MAKSGMAYGEIARLEVSKLRDLEKETRKKLAFCVWNFSKARKGSVKIEALKLQLAHIRTATSAIEEESSVNDKKVKKARPMTCRVLKQTVIGRD